jgi:hypothetical protein
MKEETESLWLKDWENYKRPWYVAVTSWFTYFIPNVLRNIKYSFQRSFRKDHVADVDKWDVCSALAKIILAHLRAYKKSKRYGYPSFFVEYDANVHGSREKYMELAENGHIDMDVAEGKISGVVKWEQVLDKMMYSFDWMVNYNDDLFSKKSEDFLKRYGFKDPHAKTKENKRIDYVYFMTDNYLKAENERKPDMKNFGDLSREVLSGESDLHIKDPDKYILKGERVMYYNIDYEQNIIEKPVQESLDLFAKYFRSLWD